MQSEVVLEGVPLNGFKSLMSYVYTGQLKLGELGLETILDVLLVANMYGFEELETALCVHLEQNLSIENVCPIYGRAHSLQFRKLSEDCCRFMMVEPTKILHREAFWNLPEPALCDLLNRDTFSVDELELFKAFIASPRQNLSRSDNTNILAAIRLPLIDTKELLTTVRKSGLISTESLMDAIEARELHPQKLKFRGVLRKDVNLATPGSATSMLIASLREISGTARTRSLHERVDIPPYPGRLQTMRTEPNGLRSTLAETRLRYHCRNFPQWI